MAGDGNNSYTWDDFCGEPIWDQTLTRCFEKTYLVWFPCGYLWLFLPLQGYYIHTALNRPLVRWTWVTITKVVISSLLPFVAICEIIYVWTTWLADYPVNYVKFGILIATLLLQLVLLLVEKKRGMQSTGYLWIFWFLMLTCGIPEFWHSFVDSPDPSFVLNTIQFLLVSLMFCLNCFADGGPKHLVQENGPNTSTPQTEATFMNHHVFDWIERLVLRGQRDDQENLVTVKV